MSIDCAHAGLFVLFPAMVELHLPEVIAAGGYPSTSVLSAWHSMASLLTLKLLRVGRVRHATSLAADEALGLAVGLNVLPKTTHASTYSHRVRREMNTACLASLVAHLRPLGLATGDGGFNLDFHSIRHYGEDGPLDDNYVPARSQSTRSVLAFFAQDHVSTDMVYANADVTKRQAAKEILAFADHWKATVGVDPGLLVFDSKLTTYAVLDELRARGIDWLTLRQRGRATLAELAALPASAWKTYRIDRAGRYRHPQIHEDMVTIKGIDAPVRQIAVRNIGRGEPTLLITNDMTTKARDLFTRYAERMLIENELSSYIKGFQVDALTSGLALNVDVDTTLTVIAGSIYRLLARSLKRYEHATPEIIHERSSRRPGTSTSRRMPSSSPPSGAPGPRSCSRPASQSSTCPSPGGMGAISGSGFPELGRSHPAAWDLMTIPRAKIEVSEAPSGIGMDTGLDVSADLMEPVVAPALGHAGQSVVGGNGDATVAFR